MASMASMASNDKKFRVELDTPVGALKTQLSKLLLSLDRVGWQRNTTSGRFDMRRVNRMMAGAERVFKSRTEDKAVKTAVRIILDLSGSMRAYGYSIQLYRETIEQFKERRSKYLNESRIACATRAAWAIASAVERVGNCVVDVYGFTSGYDKNSGSGLHGLSSIDDDIDDQFSAPCGYSNGSLLELKPAGMKLSAVRSIFEAMPSLIKGATPDYHCIRTAVEQMANMDVDRRLCIVITDGCGDMDMMGKLAQVTEKKWGTMLIGIGIQTDKESMTSSYGKRWAIIENVAELSTGAIRTIIKQIEGKGEPKTLPQAAA